VLPAARHAARRCGEGQSQTHAAVEDGGARLRAWAEQQRPSQSSGPSPTYEWWEIAAGASSSVAAHALIAAAADRRITAHDAGAIDAAYFPSVGALTVLLDDLIDLREDRAAGEHNYIAYYAGDQNAAERLAAIGREAKARAADLPRSHRHAAIAAGVVGYYLGSPAAQAASAAPVRQRLLETAGPTARLAARATRIASRRR
jgi:Protein of unknown function (DUF2600)